MVTLHSFESYYNQKFPLHSSQDYDPSSLKIVNQKNIHGLEEHTSTVIYAAGRTRIDVLQSVIVYTHVSLPSTLS